MTPEHQQLWDWLEQLVCVAQNNGLPIQGYAYASSQDFVLKHGRWYEPTPRPPKYRQGAPRCCYGNALMAGIVHDLPYVEGYAVSPQGLVLQHAWNDLGGRALDVTWPTPGLAYLGVWFCLGRADDCTWEGDANVLDDWHRRWPLLRQPWQGEDPAQWPESPRLKTMRRLLRRKKQA